MIGKKVIFKYDGEDNTGIIMDKINAPIASGTNEYCPMDCYVIITTGGWVHIVNPIFIDKIIDE